MIDLFTKLFATTKTITYFATTLSGFKDSKNRFKMFDGDESPTAQTPLLTVDIDFGGQNQLNTWQAPVVTFNAIGPDTDVETLWAMVNAIKDYYWSHNTFSDGTIYQTLGKAVFSQGWNPVTEQRVVSVALRFGIAE